MGLPSPGGSHRLRALGFLCRQRVEPRVLGRRGHCDGWVERDFLGQNDLKMWVIWGNGHFQWARWGNDHVGWKKIFSNGLDREIFVKGKHTCQYGYFSQIQVVTNDLLFLDFMAIVLICTHYLKVLVPIWLLVNPRTTHHFWVCGF